jgi:hypothetical protein
LVRTASHLIILLTAVFFLFTPSAQLQNQSAPNVREDAYRANNIGVALLEQFKYKDAAGCRFHRNARCNFEPGLVLARISISGSHWYNLREPARSAAR